MLDVFLLSGTYRELPEKMLARFGDVADRVAVQPPATTEHDAGFMEMLNTIRQLAA
jgi:hypothetical protein